jgi:hypothetical protein
MDEWWDGYGNTAGYMNQAVIDHPEDFIIVSAAVGK